MHPQGHWVGGEAMHRTPELGWGEHGAQQAKVEKAEERQREKEQAELPPTPWVLAKARATALVFLKRC